MKPTVWEKIYKNYLKGGPAYAPLSREIYPDFMKFVQSKEFSKKSAFDIGYGTGKYLLYLKLQGFSVAGIDSSATAREMAANELGSKENLYLGNMYKFIIPKSQYALIYSLHTLHHGLKKDIQGVVKEIFNSLIDGGCIYITLPLDTQANHWHSFKDKTEIEPGTFVPQSGPEKGLPHSFFSKNEIKQLFKGFSDLKVNEIEGSWHITGKKPS